MSHVGGSRAAASDMVDSEAKPLLAKGDDALLGGGTGTEVLRKAKVLMFCVWAQKATLLVYLVVELSIDQLSIWSIGVLLAVCMLGQTVGSIAATAATDAVGGHKVTAASANCFAAACTVVWAVWSGWPWVVRSAVFGVFLGTSASSPIVDAAILAVIEGREAFSQQRLWGVIGFGLVSLTLGVAMTYVPRHWRSLPQIAFVVMTAVVVFLLIDFPIEVLGARRRRAAARAGTSSRVATRDKFKVMRSLLADPVVRIVLLFMLWMGVLFAILVQYVTLWLYLDFANALVVIGTAVAATNVAEIAVLFSAPEISARIGVHGVVLVSAVAYVVRICVYCAMAYFPNTSPWWVLLAEPLHALTFALSLTIIQAHVRNLARHVVVVIGGETDLDFAASAQGLSQASSLLGRTAGFLGGAWLFERYGPLTMFCAAEVIAIILLVLVVPAFFATHVFFDRRHLLHIDVADRAKSDAQNADAAPRRQNGASGSKICTP